MKKITCKEEIAIIKAGKPLIYLDDVEEIAYDFTNYPHLKVKRKGHPIFEREAMRTNSETDARIAMILMTPEEFENY